MDFLNFKFKAEKRVRFDFALGQYDPCHLEANNGRLADAYFRSSAQKFRLRVTTLDRQ